jgi:hypothetical protein
VLGNRFACVRHQCLLVPTEPTAELTEDFLAASLRFAAEHPDLTLLYNALGAGKTVPHAFWLLSVARYAPLADPGAGAEPAGRAHGLALGRWRQPCYALTFRFAERDGAAAALLARLAAFLDGRHFNLFLHAGHAVVIPRAPVEVPPGFGTHRFGGLEMIGCFVMKSAEALAAADPAALHAGIAAVSYPPEHQAALEAFLREVP